MKCYYINSVNGKTVYEQREAPKPQPKAGELLVKVKAASLNRGEIMAAISLHKVHEAHPAGGDCAGEVEAVYAESGEPARIRVPVTGPDTGERIHFLLPFARWYDDLVYT